MSDLSIFDKIVIFGAGLGILAIVLIIGFVLSCFLYNFYIFLFKTPYCPYCYSRKTVMLFGNIAENYRCGNSKCKKNYWYEDGKSHKKDPIGFFERGVRKGTFTRIEDDGEKK